MTFADRPVGRHHRPVFSIETRNRRSILGFDELEPAINLSADRCLVRAGVYSGAAIDFGNLVSGLLARLARGQKHRCASK
jgi:hypothetical protein